MDPHQFHGKDIPHIKLDPKMTIEDLVEVFASTGFNGRQLGEAAKLYAKMKDILYVVRSICLNHSQIRGCTKYIK